MLDKKYRDKKIVEIRQVLSGSGRFNMFHTDKLLDKILVGVYDCGYEDGLSDADVDCDDNREPMYNEGMD